MLLIIRVKANQETVQKVSEDFSGYIKFVVDAEKSILAAGGLRHFEGEELLLKDGCKQENLWGGGFDLKSKELDFDSMINIRPKDGNPSREVLSIGLREKIEKIVRELLV